jgi:hypothetical protein
MNVNLYNNIKDFKKSGKLPDISRFSILRFKNHYNSWELRNDQLFVKSKLVIPIFNLDQTLKELYKDPNTTSNRIHFFFNIVKNRYFGIIFNQVRDFLRNTENYQLHKPVSKIKVIKPIIKSRPGEYIQINTINLTEFSHINHGFK